MTTWPPRFDTAGRVMGELVKQRMDADLLERVHCVLVLSEEEVSSTLVREEACNLMRAMDELDVEILIDKGNIRSHKKLIPVLEKYPDNAVLVVDDDNIQQKGWLKTFVSDHDRFPADIIYGQSNSRVVLKDGLICEEMEFMPLSKPGQMSMDLKPANGAAGTLYPALTFTDIRFFDRELFMQLSPTSDETWQFAFAVMGGASFRCLSACNIPMSAGARQDCALFNTNQYAYNDIHNAIAREIPRYLETLEICVQQKGQQEAL